MNAFELNKIAGGVLAALLVIFGSKVLVEETLEAHGPEQPAYRVAGLSEGSGAGAGAAEKVEKKEPTIGELLASASAEGGANVFKKCKNCHTVEQGGAHKIGPNLHNVVGRALAGADGFNYSSALKEKGGNWDYAALDAFLKKPKDYVSGTKMAFAGLRKSSERADMILYLRENTENPPALPAPEQATAESSGAAGEQPAAEQPAAEQPAQ